MKKIFLSGSSGFAGKNIIEQLGGRYEIDAPGHSELPLEEPAKVERFFSAKRYDAIIHTAVKPYHRMADEVNDVYDINLAMYNNLKNQVANKNAGKMLVTGTGSEYSMDAYRPNMTEDYFGQHIPKDFGTRSRYEMAADIEKSRYPIYNLRIFGLFGKYEKHDMRFISSNILRLLFDLPMICFQDKCFSYLFIDDLMPILQWFIETEPKKKTYNTVPDEKVKLSEILGMIKSAAGKPDYPYKILAPGMGAEYTGDNTRLKSEFSGLAFTPMVEAVEQLFHYYQTNLDKFNKADLTKDTAKK